MNSLPCELLDAIVDKIPHRSDLSRIRTLNKTFCAVATRRVFRHVTVKSTLASALEFGEMLQHDTVAQVIETIAFEEVYQFEPQIETEREAVLNLEVVLESLASSFARVHDLPRLKTLKLSFLTTPRHPTREILRLQWIILSAISSRSPLPSLTSLTIKNMTAMYNLVYDCPSFGSLFSSLASLSIEVAFGHCERRPHCRVPFVKFWEQAIQHRMLSSLSPSLTSLTLHSDIDVGVVPRLDFSQANFLVLECLSLKRILFNDDTHVEDFIVRHKGTLRKMWLTKCRIAIEDLEQGAPRQWSHIWTRFARELRALGLLFVLPEVWYEEPMNYVQPTFEDGDLYKPILMTLPYDVGDDQALEALWCLVDSQNDNTGG